MKRKIFFAVALSAAVFVCGLAADNGMAPAGSAYTAGDLVWHDEFDGPSLNLKDWNYEYHEPGWVNNELQKYVDSKENIYIKDGCLVIQPIKSKNKYTSGRVNTQGKRNFKYGRFEARLKVPKGQGFLPAFWMMPANEGLYGQWPKCGEIDIMEVLGNKTDTQYSSLHFGEPHTMRQKSVLSSGKDFADDFHVYACEWEPGEMRFYVDGKLFFTENDWFTKRPGFAEITYPAPYDQPFYIILNVAVGGNWPGNPDASTKFDARAQMLVDYVRVYQKKQYNENVSKPGSASKIREPDAAGNYALNGTFAKAESLSDGKGWDFLLFGSGKGEAAISGGELIVRPQTPGDLEYSLQVIQPDIPLEKGNKYHYKFDARSDAKRQIIAAITAPNNGWIRYLPDTKIQVGPEKKTYEFDFVMKNDTDPTARLEFNLGKLGSTAAVYISNVSISKKGKGAVKEPAMLPDGNYVKNGEFQEGSKRLGHWVGEGDVSVTNKDNIHEARLAGSSVLRQNVRVAGKKYALSFMAKAEAPQSAAVSMGRLVSFAPSLTKEMKEFRYVFDGPKQEAEIPLEFKTNGGVVYIDNVRVQEDGMIVNGDFSSGMAGFEVYAHDEASIEHGVDSLSEKDAFCADISKTGSLDWMIQLMQRNVKLEKGKRYRVAFDAKSTLPRNIMYALQRDGSADNNWIPYSGTQVIKLGPEFKTYETVFDMTEASDPKTILSVSMGAVKGTAINKKHTVTIDNISVTEVK